MAGARQMSHRKGAPQHQHHYITGIGDGNVGDAVVPLSSNKEFLRRRKPSSRKRSYLPPVINQEDFLSDSGHPLQSLQEPWKISVVALLGMIGLLLALFLHLITERSANVNSTQGHYDKSKNSNQKPRHFSPSRKKKKTDEWSEDEDPAEMANRTDTESTQNAASEPLVYYPYQPRYHQQQAAARYRKTSLGGQKEIFHSRPYYHHTSSETKVTAPSYPPLSSHHEPKVQVSNNPAATLPHATPPSHHRRALKLSVASSTIGATTIAYSRPPKLFLSETGQGLEGFQTNTQQQPSTTLARPLSPVSSFASLEMSQAENLLVDSDTSPSMPCQDQKLSSVPLRAMGSLEHSALSNLTLAPGLEDFITPKAGTKRCVKFTQSESKFADLKETTNCDSVTLPFMPNLDQQNLNMPQQRRLPQSPLSVDSEELSLVKMELGSTPIVMSSGANSTSWLEMENLEKSSFQRHKPPKQKAYPGHPSPLLCNHKQSQPKEPNGKKQIHFDASLGSNNARSGIVHKRSNLTFSTDATTSLLSSSIVFEELSLKEVIGGGGFGQVWKAYWRGTPVAVKVLTGSAQAMVESQVLEEFAAEINMLKGMRHPNICLYMGACVEAPNRAIVTELVANGSLWDALRLPLQAPFIVCNGTTTSVDVCWPQTLYQSNNGGRQAVPPQGSWPWKLVKRVACGAARGMTYLHFGNPPVLHRDLKSANLLLDGSYTAKVCDFGLSRLKEQERSMTGNCGTVQWMAPEVLANEKYAEPADVYSFGIIMWELLSRQCPYEGMSPIQCALAVLNKNHRPEMQDWCPPALSALIASCIEQDPLKRPTFAQIVLAFDTMP